MCGPMSNADRDEPPGRQYHDPAAPIPGLSSEVDRCRRYGSHAEMSTFCNAVCELVGIFEFRDKSITGDVAHERGQQHRRAD